jgi:serine/threonine protein phosphatase PrpC
MQPSTFKVHAGDRLLFCTDGLLEARDRAGRYFRPEDCLDTLRDPDLQAAADGLLRRLTAHAGRKLDDDVALLLLEIAPVPAGTGRRPAAAAAPGPDAVPGRPPLTLAGASAVTTTPGA